MAKVSRPIVYAVVAGVAGYLLFLYLEPEAGNAKKSNAKRLPSPAPMASGITPEDLKAHFDRYVGSGRDAFAPKIVSKKGVAPDATAAVTALAATWTLTGISSINGIPSGLVENTSTGDTQFLRVGDAFQGMRVAAVESAAIVLIDSAGKTARLTFAQPEEEGAPVAPVTVNIAPGGNVGRGVTGAPTGAPGTVTIPAPQSPTVPGRRP